MEIKIVSAKMQLGFSKLRLSTIIACFCLCGLIPEKAIAQGPDSLLTQLKAATHDSTRCKILDNWGMSVLNYKPDTALVLFNSVIDLSKNALLKQSKGSQLHNFFTKSLAYAYNNIGDVYHIQDKRQLASEYRDKAATLLRSINEKEGLGDMYSNLGGLNYNEGNIPDAIKYTKMSLQMREEIKDTVAIINSLCNLATFYSAAGDIPEAMEQYTRCLKLAEFSHNKQGISMALLFMAPILMEQGETTRALNYFTRSLEIFRELKDHRYESSVLMNIGSVHFNQKNYPKAEEYYLMAVEASKKVDAKIMTAYAFNQLGNLYSTTNELAKALNYYKDALEIAERYEDKPTLSYISVCISNIYSKTGKMDLAIVYARRGLALAREINQVKSIANAARQLKDLYKKAGDSKNALEMFELQVQMNDSLNNQTTRKLSLKTQMQYEYDKKEAVLQAQAKDEALIAEVESQRQKMVIWSTLTVALLLVLVLLLIFQRLRITRRQKTLIEGQKHEVEHQKELIEKKNRENELLLAEIHHRVKNNLQVISSLLSLQERSMDEGDAKAAIHEGKERVRSMELVHRMLYQKNSFSGIEMHDYVNSLTFGLAESFGLSKNDLQLKTEFSPLILDVDTAVPLGLILNELIVNSLKHAKHDDEKLNLRVTIREEGNQLKVNIADNGSGKVSDFESSNSFGLRIVRALIRQLDGVMEIAEKSGLHYDISLKNYKLIS